MSAEESSCLARGPRKAGGAILCCVTTFPCRTHLQRQVAIDTLKLLPAAWSYDAKI